MEIQVANAEQMLREKLLLWWKESLNWVLALAHHELSIKCPLALNEFGY